jgi:hypothetical protein
VGRRIKERSKIILDILDRYVRDLIVKGGLVNRK